MIFLGCYIKLLFPVFGCLIILFVRFGCGCWFVRINFGFIVCVYTVACVFCVRLSLLLQFGLTFTWLVDIGVAVGLSLNTGYLLAWVAGWLSCLASGCFVGLLVCTGLLGFGVDCSFVLVLILLTGVTWWF